MAHWAEIDENSIVVRVTVGDNNDPAGDEGYSWLVQNLGGTWIKTSFNTFGGVHKEGGTPLRKNYAGIGFLYDPIKDAFIPPKPENLNSWILNEDTCLWEAPIPYPQDGKNYTWNEENIEWEEIAE
jgi:hypothetical protein